MLGQNPPGSPPPGSIDFELTDLSEARSALDELPPGVRELETLQPGYWEQRRRKPVPSDRALTGAAMDWLVHLPPPARPRQLCEQFPRVANVIADAWRDAAAAERVLARLLDDGRVGRRGFPPEILHEIRLLADFRRKAA